MYEKGRTRGRRGEREGQKGEEEEIKYTLFSLPNISFVLLSESWWILIRFERSPSTQPPLTSSPPLCSSNFVSFPKSKKDEERGRKSNETLKRMDGVRCEAISKQRRWAVCWVNEVIHPVRLRCIYPRELYLRLQMSTGAWRYWKEKEEGKEEEGVVTNLELLSKRTLKVREHSTGPGCI